MSPEEREMLKRSVALAEDNNKMLHSLRRLIRISSTMSVIYWIIIIGISIGAFYFIQPYFNKLMAVYGSFGNVLKNIR
jgi:hypothetical protein